ncbi:hypothetical protein FOZ60_013431 [Perkinsus olseni]|uniref:Uncharacterized protein n=1 Tax=Perkinsus olseni TaxID=32597 RepID=A0A7J6NC62_PEROL|nr:hypothetical protein FOZ60_013431 [Perkinsus olseni]
MHFATAAQSLGHWAASHLLPASVLAHIHVKETSAGEGSSGGEKQEQQNHDHFGVLRRDEIPSDVAKAMQRLNREYGEDPPPELRRLEE